MKALFTGVYIILGLMFLPTICIAQFEAGTDNAALSFAATTTRVNASVLQNNPALITQINHISGGIDYTPSPFGLNELRQGNASFFYPLQDITLSTGYSNYGFELYSENRFYIGSGYEFNQYFAAGITLVYHNLSISNYGEANAIYPILGGTIKYSESLSGGIVIINPFNASPGNTEDQLPVIFRVGVNYCPVKSTALYLSIEKENDYPVSPKFGVEYIPVKYLKLRVGTSSEPDIYTAGFGILYDIFQIDYALVLHNILGNTHQFGIQIGFIQ